MGEEAAKKELEKEYMSIGLLAHVDAGKTTLSEAILHVTGAIRQAGRVDHKDAFLDTDAMERDRGITIFSKQASFTTHPVRLCPPAKAVAYGAAGTSGGAGNVSAAAKASGGAGKRTGAAEAGAGKGSANAGSAGAAADRKAAAAPGTGAAVERVERIWTLVDTPGHADFSTEMERVLQVLDCAVLIISAADGVTGQVRILWRLLDHYGVPAFLFVNKMDQPGADRAAVYAQIRKELGSACVDLQEAFAGAASPGREASEGPAIQGGEAPEESATKHGKASEGASSPSLRRGLSQTPAQGMSAEGTSAPVPYFSPLLQEEIAVCDDALMERLLEGGEVTAADAADLVMQRKLFPVCFGSALHEEGVGDLLAMLDALAAPPARGGDFGARVYKISHDANGARLTWMKITGGVLLPRQLIPESPDEKGQPEKATQLRFYRGDRFEALQEAPAGIIAAVAGLTATRAGMGLGAEAGREETERLLQPVLQSRLLLPPDQDLYAAYRKLRALEEEEPMLRLAYDEEKKEITIQIMGQVQREILQRQIRERFGMEADFGEPRIVYRETIAEAAEGVGHFEPLRHYAEVHLLLEPGEPGSGLVFESRCSVNDLALNWQRLILTHLEERRHRGVLTGAEITDMKISILGGRAHAKHTEGGDFRKATYRAVRQGLMMARSVLLEPDYEFRLEVPQESIGHAMADLQQMDAVFGQPEFAENTGMAVLRGTVTVAALGNYAEEVSAYTRGAGSLQCSLHGYVPCKNAEAVIAASGYDPELDTRNPSSSVFCSHGAGTIIPWYEVRSFMHVDTGWRFPDEKPSMTEDEALDLASARAQQAAMEREKKRRFLEGMDDGEPDGRFPDLSAEGKNAQEAESAGRRRDSSGDESGNTAGQDSGKAPGTGSGKTCGKTAAGTQRKGPGRADTASGPGRRDVFKQRQQAVFAREKELMQIFERTYGPVKTRTGAGDGMFDGPSRSASASPAAKTAQDPGRGKKPRAPLDHYILVDGYNIIYAWEELRELAGRDIKAARDSLMDILSNFAGYRPEKVILVFDAYKVAGGTGEVLRWHNIDVVFTKEAETADLYIEKTAHDLAKKYRVTVATSDAVEQVIIFGTGAYRMSAQMLLEEILYTQREMRERFGIGEG